MAKLRFPVNLLATLTVAIPVLVLSFIFTRRVISNSEANLSDFHINYDQGFLRRGLRGEIIELSQIVSGLDWTTSEALIRSLPWAVLAFLCARSVLEKGDFWQASIVFLFPFGTLFFIFDPGTSGNTDPLFVLLVFSIANYLLRPSRTRLLLTGIFALFVSLVHEGYVLAFPMAFFLLHASLGRRVPIKRYWRAILVTVLPFACVAVAHFAMPARDFQYFCDIGLERIPWASCGPLIFFGTSNVLEAIEFSILNRSYELTTSVVLAISLILSVLISSWSTWWTSPRTWQSSIMVASLAFFVLLPIFVVASDWGRWVSLYFLTSWVATRFGGEIERATPRLTQVTLLFPFLPIVGGTGQPSGVFFWIEHVKGMITL